MTRSTGPPVGDQQGAEQEERIYAEADDTHAGAEVEHRVASPSDDARVVVQSFTSYQAAVQAVDHLSDAKFPVERVAIVGQDLRLEEQVTGRVGWGRAAGGGAASGAAIGALFGWVAGFFSDGHQQRCIGGMDVIEREASPRVDIPDVLRETLPDQPAIVAQSVTLPAAEQGRGEVGATVEEIAGSGPTYPGQLVTVNGEVSELVDDSAFVLEDELLVVPVPAARLEGLETGSNVRVTGPAREFDVADFERRLGVDLPDDELRRYEGRAGCRPTRGDQRSAASTAARPGRQASPAAQARRSRCPVCPVTHQPGCPVTHQGSPGSRRRARDDEHRNPERPSSSGGEVTARQRRACLPTVTGELRPGLREAGVRHLLCLVVFIAAGRRQAIERCVQQPSGVRRGDLESLADLLVTEILREAHPQHLPFRRGQEMQRGLDAGQGLHELIARFIDAQPLSG